MNKFFVATLLFGASLAFGEYIDMSSSPDGAASVSEREREVVPQMASQMLQIQAKPNRKI